MTAPNVVACSLFHMTVNIKVAKAPVLESCSKVGVETCLTHFLSEKKKRHQRDQISGVVLIGPIT